jgi:hypothetical protein
MIFDFSLLEGREKDQPRKMREINAWRHLLDCTNDSLLIIVSPDKGSILFHVFVINPFYSLPDV